MIVSALDEFLRRREEMAALLDVLEEAYMYDRKAFEETLGGIIPKKPKSADETLAGDRETFMSLFCAIFLEDGKMKALLRLLERAYSHDREEMLRAFQRHLTFEGRMGYRLQLERKKLMGLFAPVLVEDLNAFPDLEGLLEERIRK